MFSKIVYQDETYPTSWISQDKVVKIAQFLSTKGFQGMNAKELAQWMEEHISTDTCAKSVVVFAQDIMPDTIVHESGPYTRVRQYLDSGGRIVWIGDTPLWNQGMPSQQKNEWKFKGPLNVLGVIQLFGFPKSSVKFTQEGRDMHLETRWTGIRPIVKDETITVLAASSDWVVYNFVQLEEPTVLGRIHNFFRLQKISIQIGPSALGLEVEKLKDAQVKVETQKTNTKVPNGWAKRYQKSKYGFVRIWDTIPNVISTKMLEELHHVATRRL
jgi:hypothetical protein